MSSIAMPSALGNISNATQTASISRAAPPHTASTTPTASETSREDTVKLSTAARVKSMYHQGQSAKQIAASLGTNVATVDGYLGVKVAASASPSTAASSSPAQSTTTSTPAAAAETEAPTSPVASTAKPTPVATTATASKS